MYTAHDLNLKTDLFGRSKKGEKRVVTKETPVNIS